MRGGANVRKNILDGEGSLYKSFEAWGGRHEGERRGSMEKLKRTECQGAEARVDKETRTIGRGWIT